MATLHIAEPQFLFKYDDSESFEDNFHKWILLNTDERLAWGDTPLTKDEGLKLFSEIYEKKVDK
jgi:hypothetical protein